jgi:hypothetical protein
LALWGSGFLGVTNHNKKLKMDYIKLYNRLCISRKLLNRSKKESTYYEAHHIQPRSLGGNNSKLNIVLLTPKEHYIAHLLLYKHFGKVGGEYFRKMSFALLSMSSTNKNYKRDGLVNSNSYSYFRESAINMTLGRKIVDTTAYKKPKSDIHKNNIRLARLTSPPRDEKTRDKMKQSAINRVLKLNGAFNNHIKSTCPICEKEGQRNAMLRWHFNNCKIKKEVTNA